jgi:putative ATPase
MDELLWRHHYSRSFDEKGKNKYTFFMDLFDRAGKTYEPLASRMRPRTLEEYVGQEHILGPGRLLRRSIEADRLTSVLLSGPPGTGKTTLARVIAQATKGAFLSVNAVLSGVKEIREVIEKAQEVRRLQGRKTILFVDEVHRWNKSQQDALLPWVENGTFILIGATTENPFFEVNSALVSRSRVFQLTPLTDEHLTRIAAQALSDPERGYGRFNVAWGEGALEHLVQVSSGDARSLLNAVELAVETSCSPFPPPDGTSIVIGLDAAEQSIQRKAVLYDKDGDYHFDTISAFIKSVRGSDPDAALYWMARMVRAGEDPDYVFRRMLVSASEDVGLADPQALGVVVAAAEAFRRVGLPEGQFHLAQAALYLATAPKSNSTLGYFDALKSLEVEQAHAVPNHLKDSSRDAKAFGHGQNYQYPHAFKDHWVNQQYLPGGMASQVFYNPSDQGHEGRLRAQILERRELVLGSAGWLDETETLTWTDERNTPWVRRLDLGDAGPLANLRRTVFEVAALERHHVVWVASDSRGLLLLEALRRTPEGRVWASLPDAAQLRSVSEYLAFVPEFERPVWGSEGWGLMPPVPVNEGPPRFDRVLAWGPVLPHGWTPPADVPLVVVDPCDHEGSRLTDWLAGTTLTPARLDELRRAEEDYLRLRDQSAVRVSWKLSGRNAVAETTRALSREDWAAWWTPGTPGRWPDYLIGLDAAWNDELAAVREAWPGPQIVWKRSWTVWSNLEGHP